MSSLREVEPLIHSGDKQRPNPSPAPGSPPSYPRLPLDLNSASAEELTVLPGIDPQRAQAAIAIRQEQGGFHSLEEFCSLLGLHGLTQDRLKTMTTIKPFPSSNDSAESMVKIDLNNAPLEELLMLPWLNEANARHLIDLRDLHHGYQSLEEVAQYLSLPPQLLPQIQNEAELKPYCPVSASENHQSSNISAKNRIIDF
jgi:competence protein ComEA